jgi:hypothetical protein
MIGTYQNSIYQELRLVDPTHTTSLRNQFAQKMAIRFSKLMNAITKHIVEDNCFGFPTTELNVNSYFFPTAQERVAEFMTWLQEQVNKGLLTVGEYEQLGTAINSAWQNMYIEDSYKRGVIRARYELQKAGFQNIPTIEATGGILMSMNVPLHMDRLGLLYTRVYTDLKGITDAMQSQIARVLTQGMADGDGPRLLARKLVSTINGSGIGDLGITDTLGRYIPAARRAEILARTEIIRAHHQGLIQEYMNWGVEGVNVLAEMVTAGDDRVCSICDALTLNNPYTLEVAMNLIPVHPQCRCMCLPFEVGVDTLIKR